jgi:hypothetical protein
MGIIVGVIELVIGKKTIPLKKWIIIIVIFLFSVTMFIFIQIKTKLSIQQGKKAAKEITDRSEVGVNNNSTTSQASQDISKSTPTVVSTN